MPVPLAVDAATMLEAFRNYGQELRLIGERQKATFVLAKGPFDNG